MSSYESSRLFYSCRSMKIIACRDAGFNCDAVLQATTEQEVLQLAGKHAQQVHGVTLTPLVAAQIRSKIRTDEESRLEVFTAEHWP